MQSAIAYLSKRHLFSEAQEEMVRQQAWATGEILAGYTKKILSIIDADKAQIRGDETSALGDILELKEQGNLTQL